MLVVGWRERVDLPLLGLSNLKAKIDTGARTSALHATDIETFDRDGVPWVRFHTKFDDDSVDTDVECPIHERRDIKNTSGVPETRIVIRTSGPWSSCCEGPESPHSGHPTCTKTIALSPH